MSDNWDVRARKAEAMLESLSGALCEIGVALATVFPGSAEYTRASNLPLEMRARLVAVELRSRGTWWIERSQRIEIERVHLGKDFEALRAENEKLRGEIASSAKKDACGDRMVQRRDDRIAELIEENNALKMNAIEQSEVCAQTVQDLALALGVELSPCSSGCPGHLPAEGVAKLKRLRAEKESEGSVPQFVKDAANLVAVLNREDSEGAPSFTVTIDLRDGAS